MRKARTAAGTAALALLGLVATSTPAHADPLPAYVSAFLDSTITVGAHGAPGKTFRAWVIGVGATKARITFDLSGLAGVATATLPAQCTGGPKTRTCALPDTDDFSTRIPIALTPVAGARAGATGALSYTTSADNAAAVTSTSTVVLADGVDLELGSSLVDGGRAVPGDRKTFRIGFANRGNRTARGFTISFEFTHGVRPRAYQNCRSTERGSHHLATCSFAQDVPPGAEATVPFGVAVTPDALGYQSVDFTVLATGEGLPPAVRATSRPDGQQLTARINPATVRAAAELDSGDNYGVAQWSVASTYDVAAIGATVSGTVGGTVKVTVGVRNNGPGALDSSLSGDPVRVFGVTIPPGTKVTRAPASCAGLYTDADGDLVEALPGKPGYRAYRCGPDAQFLGAGQRLTVQFTLKVSRLGGVGSVSAVDPLGADRPDSDQRNDRARLVVKAG